MCVGRTWGRPYWALGEGSCRRWDGLILHVCGYAGGSGSQTRGKSKHPSCNLNAIMHSPHPVPPRLAVLGWITWAYLHLVLPRKLVFLSGPASAPASAPVTCSSYYWTLFCRQSRKEERRGTLIAHLNGGCHIINAYRPALQAVTETPSHTQQRVGGRMGY